MIKMNITKQLQLSQGASQLDIHTTIPSNTLTAIYGPSGAGKTTLLKILAGLIQPEQGKIEVNGDTWLDTAQRICLPPQHRSIGFVFQDYALFPHMTVLQNLLYAAGKNPDKKYINDLLQLVKMEAFIKARPSQLSGGQQQRVALIRALVRKPQLLLLDEPLSAVDAMMRRQLRVELSNIQQQLQLTTLLVSHDMDDVSALAKNCIRMAHGRIIFQGAPQQLFGKTHPGNKLQLTGKVVQLILNEEKYTVEILVGEQTIHVTASKEEIANLQSGSTVLLLANTSAITVSKIKD